MIRFLVQKLVKGYAPKMPEDVTVVEEAPAETRQAYEYEFLPSLQRGPLQLDA
jgi:hypothetical protein